MSYHFVPCNRDQLLLLPPSLRDWVPETELCWFVLDAVEQMDLSALYARYRSDGRGGEAYPPNMMTALLLYAYCAGERSSRRIEALCVRDVAFRVITANTRPDYSTICRFRQANGETLEKLFTEILRLCAEAGLVKLGVVSLDGTKIQANAALSANRTLDGIESEVKRMLAEAEATDAKEDAQYGKDRRGDELPEELRDRRKRRARLQECRERLAREAAEQAAEQARKIAEREAEEKALGRKKPGRKPKTPEQAVREDAKANVTDPESRVMKTAKGYLQAYNAQAAATAGQIILAADVTPEANDVKQPVGMLDQVQENAAAVGIEEKVGVALMDAGYWSEENAKAFSKPGAPEVLIATTKDWKQRKALRENPPPEGPMPEDLGPRERMEWKLLTPRGRALYKLRSQTIEPVFGQIKSARGCDRFMRRGQGAARSEWRLICAAHNLLKLYRSGKAPWN